MVLQMARSKIYGDHIWPHHAWAYLHDDVEFTTAEHDHILDCEQCLRLFIFCLTSETFGAVLKALDKSDERRAA
jgi:hypothetical protein